MTCPVCHQSFYLGSRPRILPCGHTLCSPCLTFLHQYNTCVIPCPECKGEEYFEDITEIPLNSALESQPSGVTQVPVSLDLEVQVAGLILEETDTFAPTAPEEDDGDDADSQWESCLEHGGAVCWWCTTCHQALCNHCIGSHLGLGHQPVHYAEARGLLLSRYSHESQTFLEWLIKVEKYTQKAIETAESVVTSLKQTLSIVRRHISRLANQKRDLESASSLGTMEEVLEEASRWRENSRPSTEEQVKNVVEAFQRFTYSMEEFRQLHLKTEEKLAEAGAVVESLGRDYSRLKTEEEAVEAGAIAGSSGRDVSLATVTFERGSYAIAEPMVDLPLQLPFQGSVCVSLPGSMAESYTTHLELRVPSHSGTWPWFELIYTTSDASPLFTTRCFFGNDRISMWAQNPLKKAKTVATKKKHCGLREGILQRLVIVEDMNGYKVQVNGHGVALIKKMTHQRATMIELKNHSMAIDHSTQPTLEVISFQVMSDDSNT